MVKLLVLAALVKSCSKEEDIKYCRCVDQYGSVWVYSDINGPPRGCTYNDFCSYNKEDLERL